MATRTTVNPTLMIVLIALVIATVVFTSLVIYKTNQIRSAEEGNAEHRYYRESVRKLASDVHELQGQIATVQSGIDARMHERQRLDLTLLANGVLIDGDELRNGALGEPLAGDQPGAAKQHAFRLARTVTAQSLERVKRARELSEGSERQTFPALEETIAKRQTEQQQVMQRAQEAEQRFTTDIEALGAQQEDLNTKRDQAQRQKRDEFSRQATKIGQLEDRIRDLLELELRWMTEIEPDGQVLETGIDKGFVVIDVGRDRKAFPGLIFADFQYEKGRYHEKGMLEIVDVDEHIATCRVLSEYDPRHFPIARNDKVGNPVFDSVRPKVFVLAGEFRSYNKSDLEEFIRRTGGEVRDKLSPGVDYLVAGDRSDKQQENARHYQVLAMKEDQLLRFLQTTFATPPASAREAKAAAPAAATPAAAPH